MPPFKSLSAPADDAGFSEGLAEELLHMLTRLPNVRVMVPLGDSIAAKVPSAQTCGSRPPFAAPGPTSA